MKSVGTKPEAQHPIRWGDTHWDSPPASAGLKVRWVEQTGLRFWKAFRNPGFGFLIYTLHTVLFAITLLGATTNDVGLDDTIPPLQPPKLELLPGFWEQHGLSMGIAAAAAVLLGLILWKVLRQSAPETIPTAADVARAALYKLQGHAVDVALHDRVSSILRTYFVCVLHLPDPALTNLELCGAIDAAGPHAVHKARTLLVALDRHRFDPGPHTAKMNAVPEALSLIEMTEAHLHPRTDEAPSKAAATS